MNLATSAKRLAGLGHEHRLEIFQLLVQAGDDGMTVGELQALTAGRPRRWPSTCASWSRPTWSSSRRKGAWSAAAPTTRRWTRCCSS